jgi:proteic killer suppression protein
MPTEVVLAPRAQRALLRVPRHIADKLTAWVVLVEARGLPEARQVPGFHDEPLRGAREGQRSIRLSRAYRAVYTVARAGGDDRVRIEEVSKHAY